MDENRLRELAGLNEAVRGNDLIELMGDALEVKLSMNPQDFKRVISEVIKRNSRQAAVTEDFLHVLIAAMEDDLRD